ncbi:aldehyde dehydrogenase family 3 member F1 [Cynara cardunculus var. scolymus]|uniref:aldehyde dehydrogenase family 3 member F1 n=1 Tax=Cynara cardunculus var. scolymus TaxID=59895 RepID=UPI000D62DAC6|nr:aldehyde dehydrogenase family 3 member F1 [Cynara cardunculus var. scolymus]
MAEEDHGVTRSLEELRQTFKSGRTRSIDWRKQQLRAILRLLHENEDVLFQSLESELGKHPVESYRDEIGVVKKSVDHALSCIDQWMSPKKGRLPLLFFPASGKVLPEPLGLVLIIGSWNFPITLTLDPLIGAISAGNTVVLKPSELAPKCASFLANKLPVYLDPKAIKVIEGGREVANQLLEYKWDKIFFTGSTKVGKIVMSAAAKHLTPVTLELGGKCPAILDSLPNSDMKVATKRLVGGKWGPCSGQACIGIDYLLVEQKFASSLIEQLKKTIKFFYGDDVTNLKNLAKIVNKTHFDRLRNLLEDPAVANCIVYGGSFDDTNLIIEPTILLDPPLDAEIMNEEIFGPLLPIITLENIEESIEFINSKPKPLALYAFTKNESFKKRILAETSSGSVAFNDTMIQFVCDELPFGGVGQSGFGRYHGKYSFDTFSHEKAVLERSFYFELEPRHPPWNNFKLDFLRLAYNFNYVGLVLHLLGLKRSSNA